MWHRGGATLCKGHSGSGQAGVPGDPQRWRRDLGTSTAWPVQMETPREPLISAPWDSSPLTTPAQSRCGPRSEHPQPPRCRHSSQDGQPCRGRSSHQPHTPASHRFSVLRNLLPGWKRCLRLLETECFLLWGWFLQGSVEQRAEDAAAGDEELMPTGWEGSAEVPTA